MSTEILKLYPWITKDFICEIIKTSESNKTVVIKSFNIECALGKGENFSSNLIRISTSYFIDSLNGEKQAIYILKAAIPNKEFDVVSAEFNLFPKEIKVYEKILPNVECLLKSINDFNRVSPRCYKTDIEKYYLLLEDLTSMEYLNVDKKRALDFQHLKLALTKLAKWHATTAMIGVQNPDMLDEFLTSLIRPEMTKMGIVLQNIIRAMAHVSKEWKGFEHISEKLARLECDAYRKACEETKRNKSDFNVILHGDLWANNIMYKYDTHGNPCDVLFVDFAMCSWNGPGKDLAYLLFTSSHEDVWEPEWDKLIQHYHIELSSLLRKLNYPKRIPTLANIHESFLKSGLHHAFICVYINALRYATKTQGDGFLVMISESEADERFRIELLSNLKCQKRLQLLIDYLNRKGYLDI